MSRAKAGRKRKNGERHPCGRVIALRDNGCDGVVRRKAIYRLRNGEGENAKYDDTQTFDPIGRAWSAGLLENPHRHSTVLRDQGRELYALYWAAYGIGQTKDTLARFIPCRNGGEAGSKAREKALNSKLAILKAEGLHVRRAVNALCIDNIEADTGPAFVDRLIAGAANDRDRERMELIIRGLVALS